jgi:hypothetical protein
VRVAKEASILVCTVLSNRSGQLSDTDHGLRPTNRPTQRVIKVRLID